MKSWESSILEECRYWEAQCHTEHCTGRGSHWLDRQMRPRTVEVEHSWTEEVALWSRKRADTAHSSFQVHHATGDEQDRAGRFGLASKCFAASLRPGQRGAAGTGAGCHNDPIPGHSPDCSPPCWQDPSFIAHRLAFIPFVALPWPVQVEACAPDWGNRERLEVAESRAPMADRGSVS